MVKVCADAEYKCNFVAPAGADVKHAGDDWQSKVLFSTCVKVTLKRCGTEAGVVDLVTLLKLLCESAAVLSKSIRAHNVDVDAAFYEYVVANEKEEKGGPVQVALIEEVGQTVDLDGHWYDGPGYSYGAPPADCNEAKMQGCIAKDPAVLKCIHKGEADNCHCLMASRPAKKCLGECWMHTLTIFECPAEKRPQSAATEECDVAGASAKLKVCVARDKEAVACLRSDTPQCDCLYASSSITTCMSGCWSTVISSMRCTVYKYKYKKVAVHASGTVSDSANKELKEDLIRVGNTRLKETHTSPIQVLTEKERVVRLIFEYLHDKVCIGEIKVAQRKRNYEKFSFKYMKAKERYGEFYEAYDIEDAADVEELKEFKEKMEKYKEKMEDAKKGLESEEEKYSVQKDNRDKVKVDYGYDDLVQLLREKNVEHPAIQMTECKKIDLAKEHSRWIGNDRLQRLQRYETNVICSMSVAGVCNPSSPPSRCCQGKEAKNKIFGDLEGKKSEIESALASLRASYDARRAASKNEELEDIAVADSYVTSHLAAREFTLILDGLRKGDAGNDDVLVGSYSVKTSLREHLQETIAAAVREQEFKIEKLAFEKAKKNFQNAKKLYDTFYEVCNIGSDADLKEMQTGCEFLEYHKENMEVAKKEFERAEQKYPEHEAEDKVEPSASAIIIAGIAAGLISFCFYDSASGPNKTAPKVALAESNAGHGTAADGTIATESTDHRALPPVDQLRDLLCPHLQLEPAGTSMLATNPLQLLLQELKGDEITHAEKVRIQTHLVQAAGMAISEIIATDDIAATADCFLEDVQTSIQFATQSWSQSDQSEYKQPLHDRLGAAKEMLAHFGHTVLRFGDRSKLDDGALSKIAHMVVVPVLTCMRRAMELMLDDVRGDSASYRTQMGQLNGQHKTIYDGVFSTLTAGPPLGKPQDVVGFNMMCSAVGLLNEHVHQSNPPLRRQPAQDILKVMVLCVDVMQYFKTVVERMFGTIQGTDLQFRSETKALYRMAEKAFLKGPESISNGGDGTLPPAGALNCSSICDVVGCLVVCNDFRSMRDVVERLKTQAVKAEPDVMVCEVKSRWAVSSEGGWRDLICIVSIGPEQIMCEIQVVHAKLQVARKQLDAHKAYAKSRNYFEMLNFAGLLSNSEGGGGGSAATPIVGEDTNHTIV